LVKVPPKRRYKKTGIKVKSGTAEYQRHYYWLVKKREGMK